MKIFIKTKPNSKENTIKKVDETHFIVSVKEPPVKGIANEAMRKALADYFKIPPLRVNIIAGHTSRQKIVEIK